MDLYILRLTPSFFSRLTGIFSRERTPTLKRRVGACAARPSQPVRQAQADAGVTSRNAIAYCQINKS